MERWLGRFTPQVYALFRIVVGLMFMMHGTQKILGWPAGGEGPPEGAQMWLGAVIELACGALVMIGLFAGWAAFLASGQMAVAFFQFHARNAAGPFPVQNKGDAAVLFCFAFLLIAAKGSGIWSVQGPRAPHTG